MSALMKLLGMTPIRTTSYHPQANGLIEWFHRHLRELCERSLSHSCKTSSKTQLIELWYVNYTIVLIMSCYYYYYSTYYCYYFILIIVMTFIIVTYTCYYT